MKKINTALSIILILSMLVSMVPVSGISVFAEESVSDTVSFIENDTDTQNVTVNDHEPQRDEETEPSVSNDHNDNDSSSPTVACGKVSADTQNDLASASSGNCGYSLNWVLDDNGILTISGTGAMSKNTYSSRPSWYAYAADIKSIVIEEGATTISDYAFDGCVNLTEITIPEGITSIGRNTFSGCSALTSIYIPSTVTSVGYAAFKGCTSLTKVDISDIDAWCSISFYVPDSYSNPLFYTKDLYLNGELVTDIVTNASIGNNAFNGCTSLKTVTVLDGATSIGSCAFLGCTSLTSVIIPDSVTSIGYSAFQNCSNLGEILLPCNITSISNALFSGCSSIKSISIPEAVTSIGTDAFKDCTSLTDANITDIVKWCNITFGNNYSNPLAYAKNFYLNGETVTEVKITEGVEKINLCAFYNCTSLKTVELGDCVTAISNYAFDNCSSLESITMADSVTIIGGHAFSNCSSLKNIVLSDGATEIGTSCFEFCTSLESVTFGESLTEIGVWAFEGCSSLTSVRLPDSVTCVYMYAFRDCTSLKEVVLSRGMSTVTQYTFYGCNALESVYIPDTMTSLDEYAFYECKGLKSINIPASVETIGEHAFFGCRALEEVVLNEGIKTISGYSFISCTSLKSIYIPDSVTTLGNNIFAQCSSLESVRLPKGITAIPPYFFRSCAIKEFTIPDTVTSIGEYAFYGCRKLTSIDLGNVITVIPPNAFGGCISLTSFEIPSNITTISDLAFYDCTALESIVIPASVTSISATAFKDCDKLVIKCDEGSYAESYAVENSIDYKYNISYGGSCGEGVTWHLDCDGIMTISGNGAMTDYSSTLDRPWQNHNAKIVKVIVTDGVTRIGDHAFAYAGSLRHLVLGKDVKSIGRSAFYECKYLNNLTLNEGLEKIGSASFAWCTFMETVSFPSTLKSIGDNAFYMDKYLTDIVLPEGLTFIDGAAFNGSGIVNITIPSTLKEIRIAAFSRCKSLKNVYISDMSAWLGISMSSEGANPLEVADNLYLNGELVTDLVIPEDVSEITTRAFYNYTPLKTVTFHENVTWVGGDAFTGCTGLESVYINDLNAWCNIIFSAAGSGNPLVEAESLYLNGELVTEVVLPRGATYFGYAFYNYENLRTITIPPTCTGLRDDCLEGCTSLTIRCRKGTSAETHAIRNSINIEYINYAEYESEDSCITLKYLEDIKDIFITFGEYTSYTDINSNKLLRVTAKKLGNAKKYAYNVPYAGRYTILIRHNDETSELFYIDVEFIDPEFTADGLRLNITGLTGVKVIRTAYGEYSSASALKRSDTARAFSSKDVLFGVSEYYIQYRYNGLVTVIVTYESGRTVFYTYNVVQKEPTVEQQGNKIIFSELDDLKVLRYAPGEYTSSTEIKKAAGSVGISPKKIVDGRITVTLNTPGVYSFCVQYNDESHNYYRITVE